MDDFFDDILEVPAAKKARPALSKFQPKVKGGLKKGPSASHPTNPPKVSGEANALQTTNISTKTESLRTVPSGDEPLTDPLSSSIPEFPDEVGTIQPSSKPVSLQSDVEIADVPCSEIAMSDIIVEEPLGFGNINAEIDLTGFERDPVGKLLPIPAPRDIARMNEATNSRTSHGICVTQDTVSCSQDALSAGVDFQIDNDRAVTEEHDTLGEHDIVRESLDGFPENISASGFGQINEELPPELELENGREQLSDDIHCPADESIEELDPHLVHVGNECNDEELIPPSADDDIIDYSALGFDYSTYDPDDTNLVEPSQDAASARDVHAGAASDVEGSLPKNSAARVDKPVRQLRKRVADLQHVDGSGNRVHDDGSFSDEVHSQSNADDIDDNNDHREKGSLKKKRVARKRKGDGKSVESTKKPHKKFSHSTRRTKRRVNEALLQIPEDEIDYKKLKIKDLILLAEHKEWLAKKNAASTSQPSNQSADKSSQGDFANYEEDTAASEGEGSPRQTGATVQPTLPLFNYQSHMNRTPTTRWSKQDTELFYEGIRQFGTDLMMIKELFPNLTRHQIKLKYKKEERQNPLRLSDALADRAMDHSHFQLVIERLQAASQMEKDSDVDPSVGTAGKEDAGDPASQMNEEVTKPEEDNAGGSLKTDDAGGRDPEGEGEVEVDHSAKSDESDGVDIFEILQSYQSEL